MFTQTVFAQTPLPAAPPPQNPLSTSPAPQMVDPSTAPERPPSSPANAPGSLPLSQDATPACPPGQFASAFPDVTPSDWAYEAVNRLAALEIRCFPISPQS